MKIKVEEIHQRNDIEDNRNKVRLEEGSMVQHFSKGIFQKENRKNKGGSSPEWKHMIAKLKACV